MSDGLTFLVGSHALTTPVQCMCGWRATDRGAGSWAAHLADAIRAVGWRKAPQEACGAICGDGGGAGEELGLRERVEAVRRRIDEADEYEIDPARGGVLTWASDLLYGALNDGCGDKTCDEEHGDEQTPNVIVRRVEPGLMRIEVSMPAWVTPTRHGICGDRSQGLIMTNGLIDVATCELTAGHLGMHSSGDGRHWIHSDMTTAATEGDTE